LSLTTFPLLAMTVMLWILWSDTVRPRRSSKLIYLVRMVLFLAMIGALFYNLVSYPEAFSTGARVLLGLATVVGLAGAIYFFRRWRTAPGR
jgi:phosphatidylglycerophosphate synthase